MENNKNRLPKFYIKMRIAGFVMLAIGFGLLIPGIIMTTKGDMMIGLIIPGAMLSMFSIIPIFFSFTPVFERAMIERHRYVQNQAKEDLTEIADNTADITSGAIKKTAQAVKEGLKDTKYCKYCGELIDEDSVYCNKCGKKQ